MKTKSDYINSLKKIAKDVLKEINNDQLEIYINAIKNILFFIGKSALSIKHLKENININQEDIDLETIERTYSSLFSTAFKDIEKLFNEEEFLDKESKMLVIDILAKMTPEEISSFSLGKLYEAFITSSQRKLLGQVYTPKYIVEYMVSQGICYEEIIKNPYFRVVDPACGAGYFLLEVYDKLKEVYETYLTDIINYHPEIEKELSDIHSFILKNNIVGFDIDPFAVYMTKVSLFLKGPIKTNLDINIFNEDILIKNNYNEEYSSTDVSTIDYHIGYYDLVIGNPPYIGHKSINKDYRKKLQSIYYEVYSDKADISYCFFKRGYELLKENGRLILIISRYFIEAPSAEKLRNYISSKYKIESIIDFYGRNIFKGIGISPLIINALKSKIDDRDILVYRSKENAYMKETDLNLNSVFDRFYLHQQELQNKLWVLASRDEREIFYKIDSQGEITLDEVCSCNQGIITGYDTAFIVDMDTIEIKCLERDICKPWVKNSEVRKYRDIQSSKYILYTDLIDNLEQYVNTVNHIKPYKERLERRRECQIGIRQWYKLQWGRDINIFKQPKILFPYKAAANEFTISYEEVCCSADVYIISVKDEFKNKISLEYLLAFLNSSLCEFYFKSIAKKLNEDIYEYYPNKLMTLKIKIGPEKDLIMDRVKNIMNLYKELGSIKSEKGNKKTDEFVKDLENQIEREIEGIDNYFFNLYKLEKSEIDIIKKRLK